ncbi:hypothetical protein HOK31_26755 [Candidatus Poribacteria bacterium]|nr:hypothetical protein [Candidatus Poribacteria bacterium]MBT5711221.1 hypothetical protein [Candidatus Poribacteria bacterium]
MFGSGVREEALARLAVGLIVALLSRAKTDGVSGWVFTRLPRRGGATGAQ